MSLSKEHLLLRRLAQSGGRRAGALESSPAHLGWAPLCVSSQSVVRICCIRSFGHFVARLQGSILQFSSEVGIFVSTAQSEQESLLQQAQAQFRMVSQPRPSAPTGLSEKPEEEPQAGE